MADTAVVDSSANVSQTVQRCVLGRPHILLGTLKTSQLRSWSYTDRKYADP
jgi:hypothetical protein